MVDWNTLGERLKKPGLAIGLAEDIYKTLEEDQDQGQLNMDEMFMRLKDLSAYSLEHAEIMASGKG